MTEQSAFVKIPRDLFYTSKKSPFYGHANAWLIFTAILPKVRFGEPGEHVTCWGSVPIQPKEFLLNQKQLCWETGLPRTTVQRAIKKLVSLGVIYEKERAYLAGILPGIPPGHRVPILYALSDKLYDAVFNLDRAYPPGIQAGIGGGHHKKKLRQKENTKKKLGLNYIPPSESGGTEIILQAEVIDTEENTSDNVEVALESTEPVATDACLKIANEWLSVALIYRPWMSKSKAFTVDAFAKKLNLVKRRMNFDDAMLEVIFLTARNDDFWRDKVVPGTLLDKTRSGLMKVEHLMQKHQKVYANQKLISMKMGLTDADDQEVEDFLSGKFR